MKKFWFRLQAALLACSLFLFPAAFALEPSAGTIYHGIDVSAYQGDIDFEAVAADGIQAVYIRAGAGTDYKDPYCQQNYTRAKAAGLLTGFYYYVSARSVPEAREEAARFASLVSGFSPELRLAMDFEYFPDLSPYAVNQIGLAFLEETQRLTGKEMVVYSDAYNARSVWSGAVTEYPLWVAEYGVSSPADNGKWDTWAGFQYSDQGRVNGISGSVDLDRYTDALLLSDAAPIPQTPVRPSEPYRYRVRYGDTLWAISRQFGVSIASIARENGIQNPNLIYPGQILTIPKAKDHPVTVTYTVRRGDTLWAISRRFCTTMGQLAGINHLQNSNLIYPGEILTIN